MSIQLGILSFGKAVTVTEKLLVSLCLFKIDIMYYMYCIFKELFPFRKQPFFYLGIIIQVLGFPIPETK